MITVWIIGTICLIFAQANLQFPLSGLINKVSKRTTQFPGSCLAKPGRKGADFQLQPPPVCLHSAGGFHVLCAGYKYWEAEEACQEHGWRLAAIQDADALYVRQVTAQCLGGINCWIGAYNGLNQNPCRSVAMNGTIISHQDAYSCENMLIPVLCQEVPAITSFTTTTSTFTTSVWTVTTTTTVTRYPHRRHRKDEKVLLQQQRMQIQRPATQCNTCNVACTIGDTNLRIIRKSVPFNRAAAECAKFGWHLADMTSGMQESLSQNNQPCINYDRSSEDPQHFWIRSFDGVSGGLCSAIVWVNQWSAVLNSLSQEDCSFMFTFPSFPICECEKEPMMTGMGPFEGVSTSTTAVLTSTTVTVVPLTTRTVTKTICAKCHQDTSSSSSSSSEPHRCRN